jgi:hypothetical protein
MRLPSRRGHKKEPKGSSRYILGIKDTFQWFMLIWDHPAEVSQRFASENAFYYSFYSPGGSGWLRYFVGRDHRKLIGKWWIAGLRMICFLNIKVIEVLFDRKLEDDPSSQIPSCFFLQPTYLRRTMKNILYKVCGGPLIAKLVKITWLTFESIGNITIVHGVYEPTYSGRATV